jgi:hypothetical protein
LFLIDKEGRMVLVVAKEDTRVDLKAWQAGSGMAATASAKLPCS